jgi:hypothetical protein
MGIDERQAQADDPRPWEQPGAVRRDREPHRGLWLRLAGGACCLGAPLSFGVAGGGLSSFIGLPGLLAGAFGGAVWAAARLDLDKMRAGAMDPDGRLQTERAARLGGTALFVSLAGLALGLAILLL